MSTQSTAREPGHVCIPTHLSVAPDGVRFTDPSSAASQPAMWVDAFRLAVVAGQPVSAEARALIQDNLGQSEPDDFLLKADVRHALFELLEPRPGLAARLMEMAECGLLGRLFPELQQIHRRAPVEAHALHAAAVHAVHPVRRVELLRAPASPARARFTGLLEELRAPERLTLSLLLHDVGTRREHGHARESLRLAQPAIDRLQLPPASAETLRFLIRHHRQMARVAFRRDAGNPDVIARFAALVGSEELLKMLCLLTLIDIEAISPDALTPWKEDRLWRLYTDTSIRLALGPATAAGQHDAGLAVAMAGRPDDISEVELARFVTALPRAYLSVFGLSTIYGHLRLARGILPHEVHASLEQHGDVCGLTVVTLDKPFLFCNIAGVLSYFGMDIHRGQVMTTPEGLVLAVFEFSDAEGYLAEHRGAPRQIHRMLEAVVAGSVDMADLLREQKRASPEDRGVLSGASIHLDNAQSDDATVLEIVASDAPGFLYRVARVIALAGCSVGLALVSTEQGRAVDVLHITREKRRLSEPEQHSLHLALERVLGGEESP